MKCSPLASSKKWFLFRFALVLHGCYISSIRQVGSPLRFLLPGTVAAVGFWKCATWLNLSLINCLQCLQWNNVWKDVHRQCASQTNSRSTTEWKKKTNTKISIENKMKNRQRTKKSPFSYGFYSSVQCSYKRRQCSKNCDFIVFGLPLSHSVPFVHCSFLSVYFYRTKFFRRKHFKITEDQSHILRYEMMMTLLSLHLNCWDNRKMIGIMCFCMPPLHICWISLFFSAILTIFSSSNQMN